jgi:hypothetical protein
MTSNTSPEKPDWFSLIDNAAPSAQVRKVDKRVPVTTAIAAIAIMAFGALFANGAVTSELSASSAAANTGVVTTDVSSVGVVTTGVSSATKLAAPQSLTTITDPGVNDGEEMDEDEDEDDDEESENYQDDEDEDEDRD